MTPIERIRERLEEMKEREAKAVTGPWSRGFCTEKLPYGHLVVIAKDFGEVTGTTPRMFHRDQDIQDEANVRFIMHARQDVPALIAALECALVSMNHRSDDIATRQDIADILEGKK